MLVFQDSFVELDFRVIHNVFPHDEYVDAVDINLIHLAYCFG